MESPFPDPNEDATAFGLAELPAPELVFGLVGAVGTDLNRTSDALASELHRVGYKCHEIRVSELLHSLSKYKDLASPASPSEFVRISAHMKAGSELRSCTQRGDILALMVVSAIRQLRAKAERKLAREESPARVALERTAFIIRSIKHPGEVDRLREIYGRAFFVVSAYSPRAVRVAALSALIANSVGDADASQHRKDAEELIRIDEEEGEPLGQSVRESFPQGDVFVDARSLAGLRVGLARFIDGVFGNPFVTPTRDEFGMFHANAAALRSADLGRQVGAAVTTNDGEIVAVGCNDVPKFGGGLYWTEDALDQRDFQRGYDSAAKFREILIAELAGRLVTGGWKPPDSAPQHPKQLASWLSSNGVFRGTRLQNLLEYGRAVHAEMAAITDAARRGVSIGEGTLYSTTFPCHLCARHIVSAGIRRVVYIEPYPKSVADDLYSDSLSVDPEDRPTVKVSFEPFVGISPALYAFVFRALPDARKGSGGSVKEWVAANAKPKFKRYVASYLLIEDDALDTVRVALRKAGMQPVPSQSP